MLSSRIAARLVWLFAAAVFVLATIWAQSILTVDDRTSLQTSDTSPAPAGAGARIDFEQPSDAVEIDPLTDAAVADGQVDFNEYEAAVFRTFACAEDLGITIVDVRLSMGTYLYGYYDGYDTETVNHSAPLHEECYQQSLAPLELTYFQQTGILDRNPADYAEGFAACLNASDLGLDFDAANGMQPLADQLATASDDLSANQLEQARTCIDNHFVG